MMLTQYTLERYVVAAYRSYYKLGNVGIPAIDVLFIILIDMWDNFTPPGSFLYSTTFKKHLEVGHISIHDISDILDEFGMVYTDLAEEIKSDCQNVLVGGFHYV